MESDRMEKRILKAVLYTIIGLCCAAVPFFTACAENEREPLTVGVPADRCPVFYVDADTKEIVGIGVDLMRIAAEEAGYDVTFSSVGDASLKAALDNDVYDILMPFGSAITSDSGHKSIVSENLTQTPFTLVTKNNRTLPPLNELRVGMLSSLGGGAETVRELYPGIEIVFYDTMSDCVKALRSGKVDGLLHNSYVWSYVLQKPSYSDLQVQLSAMFTMDFRAGTADTEKGRTIITRLNKGIDAISDTQRQAVVLDYTTRRLYRYDFSDYLYQYGPILLICAVFVASLVVIFIQRQHALRLEQEEKMRELVDNDTLTCALSLNGFRKRVKELLKEHPDIPYLLSYHNIKNFKFVNDSLGMAAGDELLRFWAEKFSQMLSDAEAVGRISGDHFVVLRCVEGDEGMLRDEKEVLDPVRNYFVDRGKGSRLQICSGVYVLTPENYHMVDVDHMLDFARVAERRVRNTNRDGYGFYNPVQWEKEKQIANVVGHLSDAIRTGQLKVWYQPQVNFDTGKITGMEALCRWDHVKLGWILPSEFIPTLEESGLIYELDSFVWESVCRDLQRWNEQGIRRSVSVNLSRSDITEDRNIPRQFLDLIRTYGLTADQLRIEITETAFAEDPALLIQTTEKLREAGFRVEMDDFGCGYSSLHMLKEVTVDRIKLDMDFLTGKGDPEKGSIVISHIIQLVQDLGMDLIAEGVENLSQAQFLQSQGCSEMQGYYFYKPMSVQEIEALGEKN